MFLSSLFVILGLSIVQPIPSVPVETTTLTTATRHTFTHQENDYILDLNDEDQIVAFYINNNLQNRHLRTLFEYNTKSENDLFTIFINKKQRTVTGRSYTGIRHSYSSVTSRIGTDYYSHNFHCYRRDKYSRSSGIFSYRYDVVTELDILSSRCPENRAKILRYRQNPELFFTIEDGFTALDNTGKNFVQRWGWDTHWYITEQYIRSGRWLIDKILYSDKLVGVDTELADLLIFHGGLKIVSNRLLQNILPNVTTTQLKVIAKYLYGQVHSGVLETGVGAVIPGIRKILLLHKLFLAISTPLEVAKLFKPSPYGKGWILSRTNMFKQSWWNLNTKTSPRFW